MKTFPGARASLVGLVILAGCSPAPSSAPSAGSTATPSAAVGTAAPSPTPGSTPGQATLDSCAAEDLQGRIAFTLGDGQANGIGVVNGDGTDFRMVVEPKVTAGQPHGGTEGPSWAGLETILFDSNRNGGPDDWHIFRVNQAGGDPAQITKGEDGIENYAVLSPDGSFIAYSKYLATGDPSEPFGGGGIYLADPDGRHERQVTQTPNGGVDEWPDISPDGRQITFSRGAPGGAVGIMVVNTDGTGLKQIVPGDMEPIHPRWSTDGTRLVFSDNGEGFHTKSSNVWVVDADGSGLRQLTFESGGGRGGQAFHPTWSPDDRSILFAHHRPGSGTNDLGVVPSAGGDICTLWAGKPGMFAWESDWQAADLAAIVGTWSRTNRCEAALAAFKAGGLDDQIQTWVINNFVGEGAVRAPGHECDGSIGPDPHRHFFTADGHFGSLDAKGNRVDDGDWVLDDGDALSFPSHANELGDGTDVLVDWHLAGDTVTFSVDVPPDCRDRCRLAYGWAMSAFFGPAQWTRTPPW